MEFLGTLEQIFGPTWPAVWTVANDYWNDTAMTPADAVAALKAAQAGF